MNASNLFDIFRVFEMPIEPVANVTFDPEHKCRWAPPEYRREMNATLRERFGTHEVAYIFDGKAVADALGMSSMPDTVFIDPKHAVKLRW